MVDLDLHTTAGAALEPRHEQTFWQLLDLLKNLRDDLSGVYGENVLDHGVLGNGVTDDTLKIQKVLDTFDFVFFPKPKAHYKVTAGLELRSGVSLWGAGPRLALIKGALTTAIFKGKTTGRTGITIRDLGLDNTNRATAGGRGIDLANIADSTFHNLRIRNVEYAVSGGSEGIAFHDLWIDTVVRGLNLTGGDQIVVGGEIDNASGSGIDTSGRLLALQPRIVGCGTGITVSGGRPILVSPVFAGNTTDVADASALSVQIDGNGRISRGVPLAQFDLDLLGRVAIGAPNSAPTDVDLNNSQITFWLDQSLNTITIRARYSDGTLKNWSGPLT